MRKLTTVLVLFLTIITLVACKANERDENTIILGVNGAEMRIWNYIKEELAKEGITLTVQSYSDYVVPNTALASGEIDINMFQTVAYFEDFIENRGLDLVPIGNSVLAPMAAYSELLKKGDPIPSNATVLIPNDATNGGRALLLLEAQGLIELKEGVGLIPTKRDIIKNEKGLEIIELEAQQIPASLKDATFGIINNGVAVEAGYSPQQDNIFIEDADSEAIQPYINIFVVRREDENNPKLKRVVEIYQTEEVRQLIYDVYKGNMIPAFTVPNTDDQ